MPELNLDNLSLFMVLTEFLSPEIERIAKLHETEQMGAFESWKFNPEKRIISMNFSRGYYKDMKLRDFVMCNTPETVHEYNMNRNEYSAKRMEEIKSRNRAVRMLKVL